MYLSGDGQFDHPFPISYNNTYSYYSKPQTIIKAFRKMCGKPIQTVRLREIDKRRNSVQSPQ